LQYWGADSIPFEKAPIESEKDQDDSNIHDEALSGVMPKEKNIGEDDRENHCSDENDALGSFVHGLGLSG
jgi:hypothetical protein